MSKFQYFKRVDEQFNILQLWLKVNEVDHIKQFWYKVSRDYFGEGIKDSEMVEITHFEYSHLASKHNCLSAPAEVLSIERTI